jgi:hypothetical protein
VAAAASACGGSEPAAGPGGTPAPTCPIPVAVASPTFQANILPALQQSCGSSASSCHGTAAPKGHVQYGTPPGRVALDVHRDLVNKEPSNAPVGAGWYRVAPGDVTHSWLVEKITKDQPGGAGYGARMPYGGANVCQATLDTITAWIQQGAPF